jgi:hypothetical protein
MKHIRFDLSMNLSPFYKEKHLRVIGDILTGFLGQYSIHLRIALKMASYLDFSHHYEMIEFYHMAKISKSDQSRNTSRID